MLMIDILTDEWSTQSRKFILKYLHNDIFCILFTSI